MSFRVQLAQKKKAREDLNRIVSDKNDQKAAMEKVEKSLDSAKDLNVKFQLRTLTQKRLHETELKSCREEMAKIKASKTLIEKRIRLEEMKREKEKLDDQDKKLSEKIGGCRSVIESLADQLIALNQELEEKKQIADQLGDMLAEDRDYCLGEYEKEIDRRNPETLIWKKSNYERARKASETQKNAALSQMSELMRNYKVAHDFGAADTLAGFPDFKKEYDKLKDSRLLEYEDKVYRARTAAEEVSGSLRIWMIRRGFPVSAD